MATILAGFSLTGALIAAGLAAQEGGRPRRIAWVAASVLCATVVDVDPLPRRDSGRSYLVLCLLATWLVSRRAVGRPQGGDSQLRW